MAQLATRAARRFSITFCLAASLAGVASPAVAGMLSFTPTSLKMPIFAIALYSSKGEGEAYAYKCAGTTDEACMVDLADYAAVASLVQGDAELQSGIVYDMVRVDAAPLGVSMDACPVKLKGTVVIAGKTYRTSTAATLVEDESAPEEVSLALSGCGMKFPIPVPLAVSATADTEFTLSLFFQKEYLGLVITGFKGGMPQCASSGGDMAICINTPDLLPLVGDVTPTVETYDVSSGAADEAYAQFIILFDAADQPIGAWNRYYFLPNSPPNTAFEGAGVFSSVTKNANGTLRLAMGTPGATTGPKPFVIDQFARTTAPCGTAVSGGTISNADGTTFAYNAYRHPKDAAQACPHFTCETGPCKKTGSDCAKDADCDTGFCSDGVCCNTRCHGECEVCNVAQPIGICSQAAATTDPHQECQVLTLCQHSGGCSGVSGCAMIPDGLQCGDGGLQCHAGACSHKGMTCAEGATDCGKGFTCMKTPAVCCEDGCSSAGACTPEGDCTGLPLHAQCVMGDTQCDAGLACANGHCAGTKGAVCAVPDDCVNQDCFKLKCM